MFDYIEREINGKLTTIWLSHDPTIRHFQENPLDTKIQKSETPVINISSSDKEVRSRYYKLRKAIGILESKSNLTDIEKSFFEKKKNELEQLKKKYWNGR